MKNDELENKYASIQRQKTPAGKKRAARYQKEMPARDPARYKAKSDTAAAIQSGKLIKQPCEVCGEKKVDAHHEDYNKSLDVVWLCKTHHMERHGRTTHNYEAISPERKAELQEKVTAGIGQGQGGVRAGAGRPVIPGYIKKVPVLITMDKALIDWMKTQPGTRAGIIEKSLLMLKKSLEPC